MVIIETMMTKVTLHNFNAKDNVSLNSTKYLAVKLKLNKKIFAYS